MAQCSDCEQEVRDKDCYWVGTMGYKTDKPRCPACFEDAVRRETRSGWIQPVSNISAGIRRKGSQSES